jgi:hypothetical protein
MPFSDPDSFHHAVEKVCDPMKMIAHSLTKESFVRKLPIKTIRETRVAFERFERKLKETILEAKKMDEEVKREREREKR